MPKPNDDATRASAHEADNGITPLPEPPLYVQDGLFGNSCFGCGAWNEHGLRIKSKREQDNVYVCEFTPQRHHAAMPPDIVNGGIIAAVIDCHSVCSAIADAYRRVGRYAGDDQKPLLWYATASLEVNYRKPTPLASPFTVRAKITEVDGRYTKLTAELVSHANGGQITCDGRVTAVQVSDRWAHSNGLLTNR